MSKVVFTGKASDGTPYIIRYPKRTDLDEVWRYINELSKEQTFINFQGEEISLKDEKIWLNNIIKKIREKKSVHLFVESDGKIIGVSGIDMQGRAQKHLGLFGLSIAKDFRNKGIGKKTMKFVIEEAKKTLPELKIIDLTVFDINPTAKDLYKSFGFIEYGRLPRGLQYKGKLEDEVYMYYEVKL